MQYRVSRCVPLGPLMVLAATLAVGCNKNETGSDTGAQPATIVNVEADDHSGWWCVEHGIPEEECSMCSADAAAKFKEKGDWCEKHERADSQCFICHPERAEHYAAVYEAKFGKRPPAPTEP